MRTLWLSAVVSAVLATPAHAIVGGKPATRPYPFVAQLYHEGSFLCGAQLVRPNWVLTAAHCIETPENTAVDPGELEIRLGRVRLSDEGGEVHSIARVIRHEGHDRYSHDLGLLELARPSALQPIRIVTLPERQLWAPGVEATILGWGTTMFGTNDYPDELLEAQVHITDDLSCETTGALPDYHGETMFCAGEPTGGADSCSGDSGGPLIVPDASGAFVLAGVTSFGTGCGFPLLNGVYARIGDVTLRSWLDGKIGPDPPMPGSAAAPPSMPPGAGTPPGGTPPASSPSARLRVASDLGTAKAAARRKQLRVRVSTTRPVDDVRVRIVRGTKLFAKGRLSKLTKRGMVNLKLTRKLKRGTYGITVEALDRGRTVRTARTGRLR